MQRRFPLSLIKKIRRGYYTFLFPDTEYAGPCLIRLSAGWATNGQAKNQTTENKNKIFPKKKTGKCLGVIL